MMALGLYLNLFIPVYTIYMYEYSTYTGLEHQIIVAEYRVILKKASFGISRIILVSKEEKHFTVESEGKGLSLSTFSWYLVIVKIIKIRHLKGHIS